MHSLSEHGDQRLSESEREDQFRTNDPISRREKETETRESVSFFFCIPIAAGEGEVNVQDLGCQSLEESRSSLVLDQVSNDRHSSDLGLEVLVLDTGLSNEGNVNLRREN